jgi:hypothetical protein
VCSEVVVAKGMARGIHLHISFLGVLKDEQRAHEHSALILLVSDRFVLSCPTVFITCRFTLKPSQPSLEFPTTPGQLGKARHLTV